MQTKSWKSFFGKSFSAYKIDLQLKKKFSGQYHFYLEKFCCRHQKDAGITIFIYGNCMITIFFQKKT